LVVILLNPIFLLLWSQWNALLMPATQAGHNDVRFSARLHPHAAAPAWNKQRIAVLADLPSVLQGQANPRRHGYPAGSADVALG